MISSNFWMNCCWTYDGVPLHFCSPCLPKAGKVTHLEHPHGVGLTQTNQPDQANQSDIVARFKILSSPHQRRPWWCRRRPLSPLCTGLDWQRQTLCKKDSCGSGDENKEYWPCGEYWILEYWEEYLPCGECLPVLVYLLHGHVAHYCPLVALHCCQTNRQNLTEIFLVHFCSL